MSDDELKALNNLRRDILLSYYLVSPVPNYVYEMKESEYTKTEKIVNKVKIIFSLESILVLFLIAIISLASISWLHMSPSERKESSNSIATNLAIGIAIGSAVGRR